MGTRGPIPERKANLLGHRSKAELAAVTRVRIPTRVSQPRADSDWHPIAIRLYKSACDSGQAKFWEPSDYALLYFTCDEISHYLTKGGRSAMKLSAINQLLSTLLFSEAERRRVSMEIDRGPAEDPAEAAARDFYEDMLS